uniref:Cell morphogenesis protein C-terminal domain-containing protein n=1 Tax=Globisporangium ultimum (strain ATCC 200006 / CBS 805.95 / DAOM BR144) TaxID=431595 RepID=K3WLE2_GLOUD
MRYFELAHAHLAEDIARECMLVLRTLLPLAHPSSSVEVENVLDALSQYELSSSYATASDFNSILAQYVKRCMSPSEITIWSDECMKEFLLAIALYNSGGSKAAMPVESAKLQSTLCLRFSLLMYRLLAPPFHGDVFLSLMELLHHSLDEQNHDPANTNALVRDCLVTLCAMVEIMPVTKLVLYPQIVWVCIALLNHCKNAAFQDQVVDLLLTIVSKPHFLTQSILHDVLLAKRPPHWSKYQSSVLRAIVLNMHSSGDSRLYERAQHIVVQAVTLSCPVLVADSLERLVTCTFALVPTLGSTSDNLEHLRSIALDLSYLWRGENRGTASEISELLEQFSRGEPDSGSSTAADSKTDSPVDNNTIHPIRRGRRAVV